MKSYKPDENSRAIVFKELIGTKDVYAFAEEFGLSADGVVKYSNGMAPISKVIGRRLSVKLNLPYNYFEETEPGAKNEYNCKQGFDITNRGKARTLLLKELTGVHDASVFVEKFGLSSTRASRYIKRGEPMSIDTGKCIARLLGIPYRFFEEAKPGGKEILRYREMLEQQISEDCDAQNSTLIEGLPEALPETEAVDPSSQAPSTSSHASLSLLNSLSPAIGSRLKDERERLELSISAMAKKLSIPYATQKRYEAAIETIPANYLSLAVSLLDVDVVYVLTSKRCSNPKL